MLEEVGLPYRVHRQEQTGPTSKILFGPAMAFANTDKSLQRPNNAVSLVCQHLSPMRPANCSGVLIGSGCCASASKDVKRHHREAD
jgi:hypothetical protein